MACKQASSPKSSKNRSSSARDQSRPNKRRKEAARPPLRVPLGFGVVCLAIGSLVYLWVYVQCDKLGTRIKELEDKQEQVQQELARERYQWSKLKSPPRLSRLLERHGLNMDWPSESNVVRVSVQEIEALAHDRPESSNTRTGAQDRLYAQGDPRWHHE